MSEMVYMSQFQDNAGELQNKTSKTTGSTLVFEKFTCSVRIENLGCKDYECHHISSVPKINAKFDNYIHPQILKKQLRNS